MAAVNEMRLPDFSVCLQAQVGIMPLKGKCIPRVQRVVLIPKIRKEDTDMNNIEKAIEIRNARIRFVSLVDKAANLQSFLVTKNKDSEASFK